MIHTGLTTVVGAGCALLAAHLVPSPGAASVVLTICVAWILFSWSRVAGTMASPYWLFALVASLFNGGHAFLETFGLNAKGIMGERFSESTTTATLLYSALSLMLLHWGALFRMTRRPPGRGVPESTHAERLAIRLGLLLVLIALVPMCLQLKEDLGAVINSGYFHLYQREVKTNVGAWQALLAQFMLPGAFLLAAASAHRQGMRRLSLLIVLTFAASYLFMGYRGAAGAAVAAYGWIWHSRIARLPLAASVTAGALVVFVIFPMVRVHRGTVGEERLSWTAFAGTLQKYDNPAVASVAEMGGSMSTTAYTMDLVPDDRSFDYGRSYLYALLTVAPNIFGTPLHPSVARGTASEWLVRTISYQTAARRGGFGYSFIAESYLNFGWLGPVLVMIPLGYAYVTAECFASRGAGPTAMMGVVLFFSLIFARAESASISRSIVWCGFMPLGALALFVSRATAEGPRRGRQRG